MFCRAGTLPIGIMDSQQISNHCHFCGLWEGHIEPACAHAEAIDTSAGKSLGTEQSHPPDVCIPSQLGSVALVWCL